MKHKDDDKTVVPTADTKQMPDSLHNGNMTSLCKKAIKWFWLWPVVTIVAALFMAMFGMISAGFLFVIPVYAAWFVGFGFLLLTGKHYREMRGFLKMFLVVGLILTAPAGLQLARWHALGILGSKLSVLWGGLDSDLAVLLPVLRSPVFTPYREMTMLPFLLLLLITPRFLALPVFWLWVVLSALYVVLPPRAWKWMKNGAKLLWRRVRDRATAG
ncbi:MAG: hypothetical protein ACYDH4_11630, partial [Candidatus Cryosericum sp.]